MARTRRGWIGAVALVLSLAMLAAACGSSDDGDSDSATGSTAAGEVETGDEDAVTATSSLGTDDREVEGEPVRGGTLRYGMEADTNNPWVHYLLTCAVSCATVYNALADPVAILDDEGGASPYLAESIEGNDDATEFVVKMRDGIMFHDDTPADAGALAYNFNACRASAGRGGDLALITDIVVDDAANTATFKLKSPWFAFPIAVLQDNPCTNLLSPAWLRTLETNPLRAESKFTAATLIDKETVDTPATGDNAKPVGAGPFKFVSYTPGNGNALIAERFVDYWRGDGPNSVTDEGLPYLDGVELTVVVDIESRSSGIRSGQFDIMHTANADEISKFQEDGEGFTTITSTRFGETNFALINQAKGAIDPEGKNAKSPLIDVRVRRALAFATDRDRFSEEREAGLAPPASSHFQEGTIGYLEDNGYPDFDPEAGAELLQEYLDDPTRNDGKAVGEPISFSFNTTNDPFNVENNQLVISNWRDAFGDDVVATLTPIEQGSYITLAVVGTYEMQGWRQHGMVDPDTQLRFWLSSTAQAIGSPSFNFGKIQDPDIDAAAAIVRGSSDQAERTKAAEDLNRVFGEQVYFLYLTHTVWGLIASDRVFGQVDLELPAGGKSVGIWNGNHELSGVWCEEGSCEG